MQIVLVAAIGENNVIGRDGKLPWRISSDLKHFRALTLNKPVMMGRKTFELIGKPLDQRTNIVVIAQSGARRPPGVVIAHQHRRRARALRAPTPRSAASTRSW